MVKTVAGLLSLDCTDIKRYYFVFWIAMSRMSSDISEESKLDECAAGAVSSASNVYVDDVYEKVFAFNC